MISMFAFLLAASCLVCDPSRPVTIDGMERTLAGLGDGAHMIETAGANHTIHVIKGLDERTAELELRLARVPARETSKASVRYPFDVARLVNSGKRKLDSADFGLKDDGTRTFDFAGEFRRSAALLEQLERSQDPLWRAKGDHVRHYRFADADEIMPYRVYIPRSWDGRAALPIVLVLHGNTRDHDYYFDRDGGLLAKLAEQHGCAVVAPMGYRPTAGYVRGRSGELGERDAMNALDLVAKEYGIDPARVYLYGHSAGGAGAWSIGTKYASRFAGVAASAAGTRPDGFPFDKLKGKSLMVIHGTADNEVPIARSREMVAAARAAGLEPVFLEMEGATHQNIVSLGEPKAFEFFRR